MQRPCSERLSQRAKMTEHSKTNNVTLLQDIVGVSMIMEKKLKEQRKHQEWENPTVESVLLQKLQLNQECWERSSQRAKMMEHSKKNNVTLLQDIVGVSMIMGKKLKEQRKHQEWENPIAEHVHKKLQTQKPCSERSSLRAKMMEHTQKNNVTLLQDIVGASMMMEKRLKEREKLQERENPSVEHVR